MCSTHVLQGMLGNNIRNLETTKPIHFWELPIGITKMRMSLPRKPSELRHRLERDEK